MRSIIVKPVICTLALIVALVASVVSAQEKGRVEVLDVAEIFRNNKGFTGLHPIGPADATELKAKIQAQQQEAIKKEALEASQFETDFFFMCRLVADIEQVSISGYTQSLTLPSWYFGSLHVENKSVF